MSELPRDFRSQAYLLMDEQIDYFHSEFAAICGSPIEVAFATAFMLIGHHWYGPSYFRAWDESPINLPDRYCRILETQVPIGSYRVDFVATGYPVDQKSRVIIECDGHAFHERTPEQAQHDKARDRYLQAEGFRVIRFTGSEIYRDALKCAHEAHTVLGKVMAATK